jgi:hypothetical protein
VHGRHIWGTRAPNKVKVFAWLYFKDRLTTRSNLYAKHVLDDDQCQRCTNHVEDKHHVFFSYDASSELWDKSGLGDVGNLTDEEI